PRAEVFGGMQMELSSGCDIAIGESATIQATPKLPADAPPGFYHAFVKLQPDDDSAYAWIEVRKPGAPQIDKAVAHHFDVTYGPGALDFDLNRPLCVVYGEKALGTEVEAAWYVFETLEAATGRIVPIYSEQDLPKE